MKQHVKTATLFAVISISGCAALQPADRPCIALSAISSLAGSASVPPGSAVLIIGGEEVVCACGAGGDALDGDGEGDRLAGSGEGGRLDGRGEDGRLAGGDESERLSGDSESDRLHGDDESDQMVGNDERGRLTGNDESARLAGGSESDQLAGDGESTNLAGGGERGGLAGANTALSCRTEPGCDGYRLIGYAPERVSVRTATGLTTMPTACISISN